MRMIPLVSRAAPSRVPITQAELAGHLTRMSTPSARLVRALNSSQPRPSPTSSANASTASRMPSRTSIHPIIAVRVSTPSGGNTASASPATT